MDFGFYPFLTFNPQLKKKQKQIETRDLKKTHAVRNNPPGLDKCYWIKALSGFIQPICCCCCCTIAKVWCPWLCRHKRRSDTFKMIQGISWVEPSARRERNNTHVHIWSVWLVSSTSCQSAHRRDASQVSVSLNHRSQWIFYFYLFFIFFTVQFQSFLNLGLKFRERLIPKFHLSSYLSLDFFF